MIIAGIGYKGAHRFIRADIEGLGGNRCYYNRIPSAHLEPCFKEYARYIKRKIK